MSEAQGSNGGGTQPFPVLEQAESGLDQSASAASYHPPPTLADDTKAARFWSPRPRRRRTS